MTQMSGEAYRPILFRKTLKSIDDACDAVRIERQEKKRGAVNRQRMTMIDACAKMSYRSAFMNIGRVKKIFWFQTQIHQTVPTSFADDWRQT